VLYVVVTPKKANTNIREQCEVTSHAYFEPLADVDGNTTTTHEPIPTGKKVKKASKNM